MSDMIVRLYDLPELSFKNEKFSTEGIDIRRAMAPDKSKVVQFVKDNFGDRWASECDVAFSNKPISCFIAVKDSIEIVGFACYEATCRNYFGPTGVTADYRGKRIGKALLINSLYGLKEMGYAYCVIGGAVDAAEFYRKTVDAMFIPKSDVGIYKYLLVLSTDGK